MIETTRLTLLPLTLDQLRLHVADGRQLEQTLGLQVGHRKVEEPLLSIITHFTVPRLKDPAYDPLYHTIWIAIDREKRMVIADAKFKGEPDETGTVEIGYGTYPAFWRQGYMAEMVGGLLRWAGRQPGVRRVVADTNVENVASQRVLEKAGFRLFDRVEEMLWWEYVFDEEIAELTFDKFGYLVPYEVQQVSHRTITETFLGNDHRRLIWAQYLQFWQAIVKRQAPLITVWLDGSFVSRKELPNDLDIVCFIEATYLNSQYRQLDQVRTNYPLLHIMFAEHHLSGGTRAETINSIEKFKWFSLFSSKNQRPKGFLELTNHE